ncbi:MAG: cation diffusion facilitator family transporter [Cyanobacteriota bacterium]
MNSDTISSEATDSGSQDPHERYKTSIHKKRTHAVYTALAANLGIFAIKLICGLLGRSSAMLSESVHSLADSVNSICLIIGLKSGNKPADDQHPFGYGLEANVWTLVACLLMIASACLSLFWGINRIAIHHEVEELFNHYNLILVSLIGSALFELWAINNAAKAVVAETKSDYGNPLTRFLFSIKYVNKVKSPTTRFVWYEDTAAFTGVIIALIAVTLAVYVVPPEYAYLPDGIASLIIGLILLSLAIYLFRNYLTTLGAAAKPQVEQVIKDITLSVNGISEVYDLKTMDMGASGLIVNMEIEVDPEIPVKDVDDLTEKIEERLKNKMPSISHVNIEVQADETEQNWYERFSNLIEEGIKENIINRREARILENFYTFTDTTVCEVMIPRTDINCLDKDQNITDLINLVIETGHTRIPIYEESIDNIIGLIHAKDLFKIYQNGNNNSIKLLDLMRELPRVPENKPISIMLNEMISEKHQMALVADEHGGIAGLVTIEDILEEIFGEIWDEYDVEIIEAKRIDKNSVLISAKLNIEEVNERFDLDIYSDEFNTIGGYIFGQLGRVPIAKDEVKFNDWTFTVESVDGHKLEYIKIYNPEGIIDKIEQEEQEERDEENCINNKKVK